MDEKKFVIRFEELSAAKAGEKAALLKEALLDAVPEVQAEVLKERSDTMDMGATLILFLGTPAIIAIAKGIASFIARERPGNLRIETENGTVVFSGNSSDAAKIAAAFGHIKSMH